MRTKIDRVVSRREWRPDYGRSARVVTGATSGIGMAIAGKLLIAGVEVIAADLHPATVEPDWI